MSYQEKSPLFAHLLLWTLILFILAAILWAHFAVFDEVIIGEGKVIPAVSSIRTLQSPIDGIVEKLEVKEGQPIEKNEVLMQISPKEKENEAITTKKENSDALISIRAPFNGVIKQIKIADIGKKIQIGEDIAVIAPVTETLLVEAKIKPSDIGFIHANQPVIIKFPNYDSLSYGHLTGQIIQSNNKLIQDNKNSYYLIKVNVNESYLGTEEQPISIMAGTPATIEILIGHKTLLNYIIHPLVKTKQNALRER